MVEYFSHDYHARDDIKLKKLFATDGLQGLGAYWCIVEMLYEQNGRIELDNIPVIAYDLRVETDLIMRVVKKYGLFDFDKKYFYSESILRRIKIRDEKSEKARLSANARWGNDTETGTSEEQAQYERNANAMRTHNERNANEEQTQCGGNAIKENKNISLLKKLIKERVNSAGACVDALSDDMKVLFAEVVDVLAEAGCDRAQELTFDGIKCDWAYWEDVAQNINVDLIAKIVNKMSLVDVTQIESRKHYILSLFEKYYEKQTGGAV